MSLIITRGYGVGGGTGEPTTINVGPITDTLTAHAGDSLTTSMTVMELRANMSVGLTAEINDVLSTSMNTTNTAEI